MTDACTTGGNLDELSDLAPMVADVLGLLASDIALVLDASGVIHKVVLGRSGTDGIREASANWVGRTLKDTATDCTRSKVDELLRDLSSQGVSRPRHINHPGPSGTDIPVTYTAVRLGQQGPLLAVGRDLRAVRAIQQRFIDSQQELERDYWKMRQAESAARASEMAAGPTSAEARLLALVERTHDAVVITDERGCVLTANPAFSTLVELETTPVAPGQPLGRWLGADEAAVPRIIAALLGDGTLPLFDAALRTEWGRKLRVEVSVTLLPGESEPTFGFILRDNAPRRAEPPPERADDEPGGKYH